MPPLHDEVFHKALSSDIRRKILMSLSKKEKYLSEIAAETGKKPQTIDFHLNVLSEIGLIDSDWREGKKYYVLREKKILDFIKDGRSVPPHLKPKPPHEIVIDAWKDITKRLDRIEKKLDKLK